MMQTISDKMDEADIYIHSSIIGLDYSNKQTIINNANDSAFSNTALSRKVN
jgi:hypothetical protein